MRENTSKKLVFQLGAPFFALAGIIVTVSIFGAIYLADFQVELDEADPKETLQVGHSEISRFFTQVDGFMSLASSEVVGKDLSIEDGEISSEVFFKAILETQPIVLGALLFNEGGELVYGDRKLNSPYINDKTFLAGSEYINIANSEKNGYFFIPDSQLGSPSQSGQSISVVQNKNGESFIVVLVVDVRQLQTMVKELSEFSHNNIYLVNDDKKLVTGSTMLTEEIETNFGEILEGGAREYTYTNTAGDTVSGAWVSTAPIPWSIIAEVKQPSAIATNSLINIFAVALVIVLLILIFFQIYVFARKLYIPLNSFIEVVNKVNAGDKTAQVDIKVGNELSVIAETFNEMVGCVDTGSEAKIKKLELVVAQQHDNAKVLVAHDEELKKDSQKIQKLDATKSMFVSVAAHQMRTPLSAVKWALKMVMDGDVGPINPEQKTYLMKGYESNERLIRLINDLLNVDKIESGKFLYEFKSVKIEDLVDEIFTELKPLAEKRGVSLLFDHDPQSVSMINADHDRIRSALQNLIDNAIKYTIGGGTVTVKSSIEDVMAKITVSDTGIGIPDAEKDKVFTKFFRAKNAVSKETDGSGLGLFIVKEIVGKHNGSISFESEENKGTTFTVKIPVESSTEAQSSV